MADKYNEYAYVYPIWPVAWIGNYGTKDNPIIISSLIGWRTTTIKGETRKGYHCGFDIAVPVGTPLKAPEICIVASIQKDPNKPQGNAVRLYFPGRSAQKASGQLDVNVKASQIWTTQEDRARAAFADGEYIDVTLMHLSKINSNLKRGDWLKEGDLIGETGNTGRSTGPHLHLQIAFARGNEWIMPSQLMRNSYFKLSENASNLKDAYDTQVVPYTMPVSLKRSKESPSLSGMYWGKVEWYSKWIWSSDFVGCKPVTFAYNGYATEAVTVTNPPITKAHSELAPGIWQIIKLIIDSSVANRQLFDASISNSTGSLLNWFNKVCQKPFVEFMGDTWGDQYYFIARRPPFDAEGVREGYEEAVLGGNGHLTIYPNKVITTSLSWSINGAYSWYYLIPTVFLGGNSGDVGLMPAVFFPELAAIYGSRVLNVQSNYVNTLADGRRGVTSDDEEVATKTKENVARQHYQCLLDLKYLIESTIYLPFTRQGTITLYGDRRIKRGSWIYFVPTRELFYVDAVSNTFKSIGDSIQRTTVLQVSRGVMVNNLESGYSNGVRDVRVPYSYFDLVDFGDEESWKALNDGETKEGYPNGLWEAVANFKIRKDVLNYFWGKHQVLDTNVSLYTKEEVINEK